MALNAVPIQPISIHSPKSGLSRTTAEAWGDSDEEKIPELIFIYGVFGTGKTPKWMSIIEAAHRSNPETRAFCLSTDHSLQRTLESDFPYFMAFDEKIVNIKKCKNIDELMRATAVLVGSGFLRPKIDWIIVDLASTVWEWIPDYYCREALKKPGGLDQVEKEWQDAGNTGSCLISFYRNGINPMFEAWDRKIRDTGCHVIMVAGQNEVNEEDKPGFKKADKDEIIKEYKSTGVYPSVQKKIPFNYHTILHCSRPYDGRFYVQTVRDKGRESFVGEGLDDFRKEVWRPSKIEENFGELYLYDIAGWPR